MLVRARLAFALGALFLTGCGGALRSQQPPAAQKWSTGFWLWQGSPPAPAPEGLTLDVLYFQAGDITADQYVFGALPDYLPPARQYWMVFRFDRQGFPSPSVAPLLANRVAQLRVAAQARNLRIAGVQLDVDCPSGSLPQYAQFLDEFRKTLPEGFGLSITALLDWFRHDAGSVIREVDEFVPQFYDLQSPFEQASAIGTNLDAAKWGPVFNSFGKPFRIGLSSFGRVGTIPFGTQDRFAQVFGDDPEPGDLSANPAFILETKSNEANELTLTYRARSKTTVGYARFGAKDAIRFILPTPASIRSSYRAARQFGGNCAGVLFFRWPTYDEVLAMDPSQVLAAAGVTAQAPKLAPVVQQVVGSCATVSCADLYLLNAPLLSATPVRYRIRASAELEYFLPEQRMPVRMSGPSDLVISFPPYSGRPRMLLGRVVSKSPVQFTVETIP